MKKYILLIILIATGLAFTNPPAFTVPQVFEGQRIRNLVTDRTIIDKQDEIIAQLKILNIYLSKMTGEEITTSDID